MSSISPHTHQPLTNHIDSREMHYVNRPQKENSEQWCNTNRTENSDKLFIPHEKHVQRRHKRQVEPGPNHSSETTKRKGGHFCRTQPPRSRDY